MPFCRSTCSRLLRALALAPALLLAAVTSHAASISIHEIVFTLTLSGATYVDPGGPLEGVDASGDLLGFGNSAVTLGTSASGTGVDSGSSALTVAGTAFAVGDEFDYFVGQTIVATVTANASATDPVINPGGTNSAAHFEFFTLDIEFMDDFDGVTDIMLDFDWSYTQSIDASVMNDGDQAAAFFDAVGSIDNFEGFMESQVLAMDQNFGASLAAFPLVDIFGNSGQMSLLMNAADGSNSSIFELALDVGANAVVNVVPEPGTLLLVGSGLLALAARRRHPVA